MEQIYVEILLSIVTLVIVPVLAAAGKLIVAKIGNATLEKALTEIDAAVGAAVGMVAQTFVADLKSKAADGKLTQEEAGQALVKAVNAAKKSCSASTLNYIYKNYGNIQDYLIAQIEAKIWEG